MEDLTEANHPGLHRYPPPTGLAPLVKAISDRHDVGSDRILPTAGATGALKCIANTLLASGDEVLILAPYWPLIAGIVATSGGVPIEVPFLDRGDGDIAGRLESYVSDRSVAIYINTPNNPTGTVLTPDEQQALAAFARKHDLWVWSDEVYEHFVYSGHYQPMAQLVPERTFSVYSFSKAYGLAGSRCGYIIGPEDPSLTEEVLKVLLYSVYSAPKASQLSALAALREGDDWLKTAKEQYRKAGFAAADALHLPRPEGGTFLFIDVSSALDERGLDGFLFDCLDHNLILTPGASFGPKTFSSFIRVCFTCARPEVVARGVDILNGLLTEKRWR